MTVPQGTVDKAATPETEASPYVVRAETPVYGGYVIVRDGKVLFIKGAVPGELVEVSIEEKKKDYSIAAVHSVLEPSSSRRRPPCPVFGICGGCQLQFMEYGRQVSIKEEILLETMKRIGTVDAVLSPSLTAHEFRYRHRGQFKVSRKGDIGFYHEGTRDVVPVEECPLMVDGINAALRGLRKADLRGVKEIQITSGDTQTLMIKGQMSDDTSQLLIESGVSGIAFDNGDSLGKDYISLDLNGLKYTVTPWSFFQSNWALNCVVVDAVTKQLSPLENKRILDLYAGAGNFSLPLALGASEVTAVEENPAAIEDGRRNAMLNSIRNCRFVNLSVEKSLEGKKKQQVEKTGKTDAGRA